MDKRDVYEEVIKKLLELSKKNSNTNSNIELEFRFGSFNNGRFTANVEIDFFYRLKKFLEKMNLVKRTIYTIEESNENVKKITENNNIIFQKKIKLTKPVDIISYEFRCSISKEEIVKEPLDFKPSFSRIKNRISYFIGDYGKVDLTIVNDNIYEV